MVLPRKPAVRAVVENLWPCLDEGRTPARRVPGDVVDVYADVYAEGSASVRARVRWRAPGEQAWNDAAMVPIGNDRWHGRFNAAAEGEYRYTVEGWVDPFRTWLEMLERRVAAGSVERSDVQEGVEILELLARQAGGADGQRIRSHAEALRGAGTAAIPDLLNRARSVELDGLLAAHPDPSQLRTFPLELPLVVDPSRAAHSAWYEVFPRSTGARAGQHGTLRDLCAKLPYIADLGFTVVYLPPVHPIGITGRRGPNNTSNAPRSAPGSPWAIGSEAGGHMAIHPELGSLADFQDTVREARRLGLEIAVDLALQCSPDHPWVREHPDWFSHRPDGTVRPAENPPKRYDDIFPLDFTTRDWPALWEAIRKVVDFWIGQGVAWFRVDNPHTKPFGFWQWLISDVRREHPEVLFLAEAFTRPKVMYQLAKVGFTHSYTYFAWRTTRAELTSYFEELTRSPVAEFFRPHLWPNTPDILTEQFHSGHRSVFVTRLVLAATLSSHYGIYGPAFELGEHTPLEAGKEEYRDSEKYALKTWRWEAPGSLAPELRRINQIRKQNVALRSAGAITFHPSDNDTVVVYSRRTDDRSNVVLVVVNLDPVRTQSGWITLDLDELGIGPEEEFMVHDLWSEGSYRWRGPRNYFSLDPGVRPVHVFRVDRRSSATSAPLGGSTTA